MFFGSNSCGAPTPTAATKEALVQVAVKAKNLGFCRILFLCCSNRLVQVCNQNCNPSWEDKTLLHDIVNLQHQGVCCKALFVPRAVLGCVCKYATNVPGACNWTHPDLEQFLYLPLLVSKKKKKKKKKDF